MLRVVRLTIRLGWQIKLWAAQRISQHFGTLECCDLFYGTYGWGRGLPERMRIYGAPPRGPVGPTEPPVRLPGPPLEPRGPPPEPHGPVGVMAAEPVDRGCHAVPFFLAKLGTTTTQPLFKLPPGGGGEGSNSYPPARPRLTRYSTPWTSGSERSCSPPPGSRGPVGALGGRRPPPFRTAGAPGLGDAGRSPQRTKSVSDVRDTHKLELQSRRSEFC